MNAAFAALRRMKFRPRIWLGLMVLFGLGLGQVPLFGVLGLELAVAAAAVATICGLDLGAALARELVRKPGAPVWAGALVASGATVALTLVPALICTVRGAWTPTCDWSFGVLAYAAMPLVSAALFGALGHVVGILFPKRRFLAGALAQLPLVAFVFYGLWRFYAAPPVFTYSPILGYFPGNLYDENVQLGMPLLWSRLEQIAWVVGLVALVAAGIDARYRLRLPRRLPALALAGAMFAGAIVLHVYSGALGYAVDASDIEDELDGTVETAHFVIHYAHTEDIDRDIALIAADHELRYAQVVAQTGVAPDGKITSFYFATGDQKARWMGARDVEMAKPWRHEIYLDHRPFPHPSLRHEIAHAIASAFGDPVFGVATKRVAGVPLLVNPGIVEGLAVALDWPGGYERLTPHEAVRAMQSLGLEPSLDELLSLRFFGVSSARGYTTAGSFLRFLLDTYGAAKLRELYSTGGDFDGAYGKPLDDLEHEWREMLSHVDVPPEVIEAQKERFRGGGVFGRPCPHAIAARRERAYKAAAGGDRDHAIALMREVCSQAPEEPRHRLELGDYLAGGKPDERAEAERVWADIAADTQDVTSSLRGNALERLAKTAGLRDDFATVKTRLAEARSLPIDGDQKRQLDGEWIGLDHPAVRGYFFSPQVMEPIMWAVLATVDEPDVGFAHYLLGLRLANANTWAAAATELDHAIALGLPGPAFVKNAARVLAIAAYRSHDPTHVRVAIATLAAPGMSTADHLLAADWQSRLDFDK